MKQTTFIIQTALLVYITLQHTACQKKDDSSQTKPLSSTATLTNLRAKLNLVDSIALKETPENFIGLIYTDVFTVSQKRIIFVDYIATDIKIFDMQGRLVRRLGKVGSGPGEYRRIMGIAEDAGYLYIHDDVLRRITLLRKPAMSYFRSFSTPKDVEANPGDLAIFNGRLYISSWDLRFKPTEETYKVKPIAIVDTTGHFLDRLGEYDELYKKLRLRDEAVLFDQDTAGNIYLAQKAHYRIAKYSPQGESLRRARKFPAGFPRVAWGRKPR